MSVDLKAASSADDNVSAPDDTPKSDPPSRKTNMMPRDEREDVEFKHYLLTHKNATFEDFLKHKADAKESDYMKGMDAEERRVFNERSCRVLSGNFEPEEWVLAYTHDEIRRRQKMMASSRSIIDRLKFEKEFDVHWLRLPNEEFKMYRDNPHMRQVFANREKIRRFAGTFSGAQRYIEPGKSPRLPYRRRLGEAKTTEHWGQRKLLFSEIEFLTECMSMFNKKDLTVVYAGAAPSTHTNYLSDRLFPTLNFVLVDPAPFDAWQTDRIKIVNDYFTDDLAKSFAGRDDVVFISDVRATWKGMSDGEMDSAVSLDMKWQQDWFEAMKPLAALFKFRLPYTAGKTRYLKGRLYLPVWGGRTTTETRLLVTGQEYCEYDNKEYEEMMFYFNKEFRTTFFDHDYDAEGIDHCFDCRSEIHILTRYLEVVKGVTDPNQLKKQFASMSEGMSRLISKTGRSLSLSSLRERHADERDADEDDDVQADSGRNNRQYSNKNDNHRRYDRDDRKRDLPQDDLRHKIDSSKRSNGDY